MAASPAARSSWTSQLGIAAFGLVLVFGVFLFSTAQFGFVQGEEFSPDTFERREFTFYQLPLVGIQLSPVKHSDTTGPLEDHLRGQGIVPSARPAKERWDLVEATRGQKLPTVGDARILCNYLRAEDADENHVWLKWSQDHQEAARFLWPIIAQLAKQELYIFVPELFSIARDVADLPALKNRINAELASQYLRIADSQRELGHSQRAIELYTESLKRSPENLDALEGRAAAYSQLGDDQLADADLATVRRLRQP